MGVEECAALCNKEPDNRFFCFGYYFVHLCIAHFGGEPASGFYCIMILCKKVLNFLNK